MNNNDINALAALATFRQIYNDNQDICFIVSKFVANCVKEDNAQSFSLDQMRKKLLDRYNFDIPDKVISKAIRVHLEDSISCKDHVYYVNKNIIENTIEKKLEEDRDSNLNIGDMLSKYIENQNKTKLSNNDKSEIFKDFVSYLKGNGSGGQWSHLISSFVVINQDNQNVINQINKIKEGAILYSGLIYSPDINESMIWRKKLVLFLEHDVLFHLAGYNGQVFQRYVLDMINLIDEMNSMKSGKKIYLKYFADTKKEIDNFFNIAEDILVGNRTLDINNKAMCSILQGCTERSDIAVKKSLFYKNLDRYCIEIYDEDYYDSENYEYNIESIDIVNKLELEPKDKKYLRHISYSNIARNGEATKFIKSSNCLVLSEATVALKIEEEINDGCKYVVNMEMLTNALWFDLKKGFGGSDYPSNFDILLRAETTLSSILSKSVSNMYDDLLNEYKSNEMSKERAENIIVYLKSEIKLPEEINKNNINDTLDVITNEDINKLEKKHIEFKNEYESIKIDIERLKIESNEKNKELISANNNSSILEEKLNDYVKRDNELKKKIIKKTNFWINVIKNLSIVVIIMLVSIVLLLGYFINPHFLWLGSVFPVVYIVFRIIYGIKFVDKFNPLDLYKILIIKCEVKVREKFCEEYNIDYFDNNLV